MYDITSEVLGIPTCNSADHTSPDGFLDCLRTKINTAGHATTAMACNNLSQCTGNASKSAGKPGMPALWGHANEGFIVTGTGQVAQTPDKYVSTFNQSYWEPEFQKLAGRYQVITLNGCHPGAGIDGAELLYRIAKVVGCAVRGPTGFLYCGDRGIWLEDGAVYQVATPSQKPTPIPPPTPHFSAELNMLQLNTGSGYTTISDSSVFEATISRIKLGERRAAITFSGKDVLLLLSTINFSAPVEIPGRPAAIHTAQVILRYYSENRKETGRTFNVFNDRLAADSDFPNTFYQIGPGFKTLLESAG